MGNHVSNEIIKKTLDTFIHDFFQINTQENMNSLSA